MERERERERRVTAKPHGESGSTSLLFPSVAVFLDDATPTLESTMTSPSNPHGFFPPEGYDSFTPPPPYLGASSTTSKPSKRLSLHCLPLPPLLDSSRPIANPMSRLKGKPELDGAAASPPCIECGKRFSSSKALYGHMRCHPERPYRGMTPRTNFSRPFLLGSTTVESEFTNEEHEVAKSLIMLAGGPPKAAADMNGVEIVRSLSSGYHFQCPSCPKVFGSHKALARHRASHRKDRVCMPLSKTGDCDGGGEEMGSNESVGKKRAWEEAMVLGSDHKCNVCYRGFSTGQALGGHKRCHWEKGEEHAASCFSTKCYVWDLNLPPPLDEGSPPNPSPVLDLKLGI